jgi:iron complex outermembrane receptor protein
VKSNVLGKPMKEPEHVPFEKNARYLKSDNRSNISFFLEHNVILDRFTLSAGVLANYHSSLNDKVRFYPGIDMSYRLGRDLRLYGSWNRALRMPTFTDLYYESKELKGNPDMKPEESEAFEIGFKYNTYAIRSYVAGFYRKGKNMIDWVKKNPEDIWESHNLTKVDNYGIETGFSLFPRELGNETFFIRKAEISYAFIHQEKDSEEFISNYALDYLKHKFTAQLNHSIWKGFSASWYLRWQDRAGSYTRYKDLQPAYEELYPAYCVVDVKINWQYKDLNIYTEVNNIFDRVYYDLGNIPQPGIWFRAGFSCQLSY